MLKKKIFTPGPTQVHPEVLEAVTANFTYHRSEEFREFHKSLLSKLKQIFFAEAHLNILTASGTGAMEAVVLNFCSNSERVLYINQGKFGKRWGIICDVYRIPAEELKIPYGDSVCVELLKEIDLERFSAVFLTHAETSTATITDIHQLAGYIRSKSNALVIVDAISSIGTVEFNMEKWNIDVAVSASQKGFMSPPGLSIVAFSNRAFERMLENKIPKYYFDLKKESEVQKTFSTSWTPALGVMYGLDKACDLILEEGIENRWQSVHRMAEYFREECKRFGFGIFSKCPADSLTAITFPGNIPTGKLVSRLKEKYGIQIANGQADIGLKDKIARISHMGDLNFEDTCELLKVIKMEYRTL